MISKPIRCFLFLSFLFLSFGAHAQKDKQPPYWNDIQYFKKIDSIAFPPKGKILMIGSSSFTFWKDVAYYLPGYPFINRGFGGSSLPHLIRYFDDIVVPYHPRQILIYCGENDLGGKVNGDTVFSRFKTLFHMIRQYDKKVQVTYISMKPSPSRIHLIDEMRSGNEQIKNWLASQKRADFIDVFSKMLDENGQPKSWIYRDDKLHMNGNGYFIWAKEIHPYLLKK